MQQILQRLTFLSPKQRKTALLYSLIGLLDCVKYCSNGPPSCLLCSERFRFLAFMINFFAFEGGQALYNVHISKCWTYFYDDMLECIIELHDCQVYIISWKFLLQQSNTELLRYKIFKNCMFQKGVNENLSSAQN